MKRLSAGDLSPFSKQRSPFSILALLHAIILLLVVAFLAKNEGEPRASREKILVIPIEGVITMKDGSLGYGQSVMRIVKTLERAGSDDRVKAVVLHINSPGGSVGAVQEIYRAVQKARQKGKVVVSSFGDVSASGGYYIACAGDRIVSLPGTLTGSIGVVMQVPTMEGLLKKIGVKVETVKSGRFKDAGSPFRSMTEPEKKYFSKVISNAYGQFFAAVKKGRGLDDSALNRIADGRVLTGAMALKAKLVDELGGLDDAVEQAKKLAGLTEKKPEIIYKKDRPSLERLLRLLSRSPLPGLKGTESNHVELLYLLQ